MYLGPCCIALFLFSKRFDFSGLWKLAQSADFSPEELESLRIELKHYEQRIKKLHHLEAELKLVRDTI